MKYVGVIWSGETNTTWPTTPRQLQTQDSGLLTYGQSCEFVMASYSDRFGCSLWQLQNNKSTHGLLAPALGGQSNNSVMKQQPDAVHDVLQQAEDITLPRAVKQCKKPLLGVWNSCA